MLRLRWLLSAEGRDVLVRLGANLQEDYDSRVPDCAGPVGGMPAVTTPWDEVLYDFVMGIAINPATDPPGLDVVFRTLFHDVYRERYDLLRIESDAARLANLKLQAMALGLFVRRMLQLEMGDFGDWYGKNPAAKLDAKHFGWARDLLGFYLAGKTRLPDVSGPHIASFVPLELGQGCTLC